jgi:predicted HNH restriction endonuclease
MDNLEKQIKETFKDPESQRAIMRLVHNGGEQKAFSQWLSKEITEKGIKGLWNPMCLFRSYNLRRKDPGKEKSDRIRAEIRAAVENGCPFKKQNWNRDENKKIYEKWKKGNENNIRGTHLKNSENRLENSSSNLFPDEIKLNKNEKYLEGALKSITVNAFERDPKARKKCIEAHGVNCIICGFNFEKQYGEIGNGFIHVHHIKPLSEIGEEYEIDPIKDLCPICPNCHAMMHRKNPPYSTEEIKNMIAGKTIN